LKKIILEIKISEKKIEKQKELKKYFEKF